MSNASTPRRGYLTTIIGCYCPRCREGKLFVHPLSFRLRRIMQMNEHCPVCSQLTDIEVGFYYGTSYVSYLIALGITAAGFLLFWLLVGFSYEDNRFFYWIFGNAVLLLLLQPWLMRFSRSLWISLFVRYDPDWKHTKPVDLERVNRSEMNNW